MVFESCAYCKRRFAKERSNYSCMDGMYFCSPSCLKAYENNEAARYEREIQFDIKREQTEELIRQKKELAEAEAEKAYAIQKQTEYLRQKDKQEKREREAERALQETIENCKIVKTNPTDNRKYRMAHRPFKEFEALAYIKKIDDGIIEFNISKIINNTPNGTGELWLEIFFDDYQDISNWETKFVKTIKLPTGETGYMMHPYLASYRIPLGALDYNEDIVNKVITLNAEEFMQILQKEKSYIQINFSIEEAIYDGMLERKSIKRFSENRQDFFKFCKDYYLENHPGELLSYRHKNLYGVEIEDFLNRKSKSKIDLIGDLSGDCLCLANEKKNDSDYIWVKGIKLRNRSDHATGSIQYWLVYENPKNKRDFEIVTCGINDHRFLFPDDYIEIEFRPTPLKIKEQQKKNFIPCLYILERSEKNPDIPVLLAKAILAKAIKYIDLRNSSAISKDIKIKNGYVLNDEDGYLFVLDEDSNTRFYFHEKGSTKKVKECFSDIMKDGKLKDSFSFPTEISYIPLEQINTKSNGTEQLKQKFIEKSSQDAEKLYNQACDIQSKNPQKAFELFLEAAKKGHAKAQFKVGVHYDKGEVKDFDKALEWFQKAADQNHEIAIYNVGVLKYAKNEYSKSFECFKKAASLGHQNAKYYLATQYNDGLGTSQNKAEAKKLLLELIYKEHEKAMDLYKEIIGSDADSYGKKLVAEAKEKKSENINMFREAAALGNIEAQYELGMKYLEGKGTDKDISLAMKWLEKSANQNYIAAQNEMAEIYYKGKNGQKSYGDAVVWYKKAADQGNKYAIYSMGWAYEHGQGVTKSYKSAVEWYKKAAEKNHASSQYCLGLMYLEGNGVKADKKIAKEWLKKAADNGNEKAAEELKSMKKSLVDWFLS